MTIAHVKWFIDSSADVPAFSFSETSVWIWLIIASLLIGLAALIEYKWADKARKQIKWIKAIPKLTKKNKLSKGFIRFFQIALGASLLFASLNSALLVPHFVLDNPKHLLLFFQVGIGLLMLLNFWVPFAAGLLIVLYLISALLFGPLEALDYINVIGIALFFILINHKEQSKKKQALPLLRISTGLALVILAFSEKLLAPQKALALLSDFDLNFMSTVGFEFSDRLFILSAGTMEAVFGLILIFGWITRINVLSLAVFLIASNLYFLFAGHPQEALVEIMGHIPVIASALLFIIWGNGRD